MNKDIQLKGYVRFFSKSPYYSTFCTLLKEAYAKSIYCTKKGIFCNNTLSIVRNYWQMISKSLFKMNTKYCIPELAVNYLSLQVLFIFPKLIKIAPGFQMSLSEIIQLYIEQQDTEIVLAKSRNFFRSIVEMPIRCSTKQLSRNVMKDMWNKLNKHPKIREKEKDNTKRLNENIKGKIPCRYQVITPYIRPTNDNPIDSEALCKRLNENFEMIKFNKTLLRSNQRHSATNFRKKKPRKCKSNNVSLDLQNQSPIKIQIKFRPKFVKNLFNSPSRYCNKINSEWIPRKHNKRYIQIYSSNSTSNLNLYKSNIYTPTCNGSIINNTVISMDKSLDYYSPKRNSKYFYRSFFFSRTNIKRKNNLRILPLTSIQYQVKNYLTGKDLYY